GQLSPLQSRVCSATAAAYPRTQLQPRPGPRHGARFGATACWRTPRGPTRNGMGRAVATSVSCPRTVLSVERAAPARPRPDFAGRLVLAPDLEGPGPAWL